MHIIFPSLIKSYFPDRRYCLHVSALQRIKPCLNSRSLQHRILLYLCDHTKQFWNLAAMVATKIFNFSLWITTTKVISFCYSSVVTLRRWKDKLRIYPLSCNYPCGFKANQTVAWAVQIQASFNSKDAHFNDIHICTQTNTSNVHTYIHTFLAQYTLLHGRAARNGNV